MDRHTPATDASYYGGQYMTPAHYVNRSQEEEGEERLEHGGVTECLREQDIYLPIANIGRIMNSAIPESLKTSKDAKDTVQECVSEFISFVTSEASDRCIHEKRKTISGEDILYALSALGFDAYVDPMKLFLQRFREFRREAKGLTPGTSVSVGEERLGDGEELPDDGFTSPLPAGIATADGQQQNAMVYTNNTAPYQQAPAVEQTQFPRQEISPPAPSATAAAAAHDATVPKGPAVTDHQV